MSPPSSAVDRADDGAARQHRQEQVEADQLENTEDDRETSQLSHMCSRSQSMDRHYPTVRNVQVRRRAE